MRRNTIKPEELPNTNLALYQLIKMKSSGIIKDFALGINATPQSIQRLFKIDQRTGKYPKISDEIRKKVADKYGLEYDWCDKMGERLENEKVQSMEYASGVETAPRITQYACAGSLTEAIQTSPERYPIIRQMPRYDFTIVVRGDSMEPEFRSGDEIACLDVSRTGYIQWGKPHVLATSQGVVIKRPYDDENGIRCESDNPKYKPFIIPKDQVYSIALVVGVIRL